MTWMLTEKSHVTRMLTEKSHVMWILTEKSHVTWMLTENFPGSMESTRLAGYPHIQIALLTLHLAVHVPQF